MAGNWQLFGQIADNWQSVSQMAENCQILYLVKWRFKKLPVSWPNDKKLTIGISFLETLILETTQQRIQELFHYNCRSHCLIVYGFEASDILWPDERERKEYVLVVVLKMMLLMLTVVYCIVPYIGSLRQVAQYRYNALNKGKTPRF
jgi:hypothetical protein